MLRPFIVPVAFVAGSACAAAIAACGGSGALTPPISDSQYDDPDDPGGGGSQGAPAPAIDAGAAPIVLPGGAVGIDFDDMRYSGDLATLLVPAGRTGNLDFVDSSTEKVTWLGGFSATPTYSATTSYGVTSADEGDGIVYATDRTSKMLYAIQTAGGAGVVASVALAATPGYVRYVPATSEVWVTLPGQNQIEIFTVTVGSNPAPTMSGMISVPGVLQSLEVMTTTTGDGGAVSLAFTQTATATVAIDAATHMIAGQWQNGCVSSQGLAVDPTNGWVMSACAEGKVFVLSTQGTALGSAAVIGAGVGGVTYDAARQRLYVPSVTSQALSVIGLGTAGQPSLLGSLTTPGTGACAVTAGGGGVFVCVPSQGQLLFVYDPF